MDKKELMEEIGKSESEVDSLVEDYIQVLEGQKQLVTPTFVRKKAGIHHRQSVNLKKYLVDEGEVVQVPSTAKGDLIVLPGQLEEIVSEVK